VESQKTASVFDSMELHRWNNLKFNVIGVSITLDGWFEKWMSVYKYKAIRDSTRMNYITMHHKHISPYSENISFRIYLPFKSNH